MPRTIRIGKSIENDYVINNPTVSRNHATLTVADDNRHAILRDLGSKNGTYVNGTRITKETNIDLSHQLGFGSEKTTLSTIIGTPKNTVIRAENPNSRMIGRGSDCQIRMNYDDVSSRHAILSKRTDGSIQIEDCGSRNGIFVNGERVISRVLSKGDRVTITRNYVLDWEGIFPTEAISHAPQTSTWKRAISIAAVIFVIVCLGGGAYYLWKNQTWDKERIYDEYNTAVCWVCVQYGYKIFLDGEDITPNFCNICEIKEADLVHLKEGKPVSGAEQSQGTAFFISHDGKLATNLHITRPWLYSDDIQNLESGVNKIIAVLATRNPLLSRSQVKVEGIMEAIYIIPNGLPISDGNLVKCTELKGYDDINKDVAVIQTETRGLPTQVKNIIDITHADTSDEAIKEGKAVFTIGFPYGAEIARNSNQELKNQVHGGSVTQNRGEYEFGHDAETAGGASGSPIINDKGHLIGIHHAGLTGVTGAQGFNWAIKAKYIVDLLN